MMIIEELKNLWMKETSMEMELLLLLPINYISSTKLKSNHSKESLNCKMMNQFQFSLHLTSLLTQSSLQAILTPNMEETCFLSILALVQANRCQLNMHCSHWPKTKWVSELKTLVTNSMFKNKLFMLKLRTSPNHYGLQLMEMPQLSITLTLLRPL